MEVQRWRWAALVVLAIVVVGAWWFSQSSNTQLLANAETALTAGDRDAVNGIVQQFESRQEAEPAAFLRGRLLLEAGKPDAALAEFNRVRTDGPLKIDAAAYCGRCFQMLGDRREAQRVYSWVVEQNSEHAYAHRGLAALAYDQGELLKAVYHLEQVARIAPKDGRPYRLIGLIAKDLDHRDEAEQAYRAALERDLPTNERRAVLLELAGVLVARANYDEALKTLDQLTSLAGASSAADIVRIEAVLGSGDTGQGLRLLGDALKQSPQDAELLRLQGEALIAEGKYAEAATALEAAAKRDDFDHRIHQKLAAAYLALQRTADAAREQARVEELRGYRTRMTELQKQAMDKPGDAAVRLELADLCIKIGKPLVAQTWRDAAAACPR